MKEAHDQAHVGKNNPGLMFQWSFGTLPTTGMTQDRTIPKSPCMDSLLRFLDLVWKVISCINLPYRSILLMALVPQVTKPSYAELRDILITVNALMFAR